MTGIARATTRGAGRPWRRLGVCVVVAALLAVVTVLGVARWVRGTLPDVVNSVLTGRAAWSRLDLAPGTLVFHEVKVVDSAGHTVLTAPEVRVKYSTAILLRTFSVAGSMQEVDVERPRLDVVVNPAGALNLASLFRPAAISRPASDVDVFRAVVTVHDGDVFYRDTRGSGFLVPFSGVRGQVDLRAPAAGSGFLAGAETGKAGASVRVDATWGRGFSNPRAAVGVERLALAPWVNYLMEREGSRLPREVRMLLQAGEGRARLLVSATGNPEQWRETVDLTGSVEVKDLAGRLVAFPVSVREGKGTALIARDLVNVRGFQGLLNGDAVSLSGRIFHFGQPQVDLSLRARTTGVRQALERLGLRARMRVDGEVSAALRLDGSLANPSVHGRVESPRLDLGGHLLRGLRVDFERHHGMVRLERASADAEGGRIQVSGWVSLDSRGGVILHVETRDALLRGLVGDSLGRPARGSVDLTWLGRGGRSPLVFGRGRFTDVQVDQIKIAEAEGSFSVAGGTVLVRDVTARTSLGSVRAPAALMELDGRRRVYAEARATGVNYEGGGTRVSEADADLQVSGTLGNLAGWARIHKGSITRGGITLDRLSGVAAFDPGFIYVPGMEFDFAGTSMWGSGGLSLAGGSEFGVALRSPSADAARLLAALAPGTPWPREVGGRGPFSLAAVGDANLAFWGVDWQVPWGDLRAEGMARPKSGSMGGVVVANGLDAGLLSRLGLASIHPAGRVSATALFESRPGGGWSFDLAGVSPDLALVGMPIRSLGAQGSVQGRHAFLDFLSAVGPAGTLRFHGLVPLRGGSWDADWRVDDINLAVLGKQLQVGDHPARVLDVFRRTGLDTLQGRGQSWGRVEGRLGRASVKGTLKIDQAVLHKRSLTAYVPFMVKSGRVWMNEGVAGLDGDQMLGSGWVDAGRPYLLDLRLSTRRFEIPQLLEFTPYSTLARRGWVDGSLRLAGPWNRMVTASGKMRLHDAVIAGQPVEEAHAVLEARPGAVILKDLQARIGGAVVEGGGIIRERGPLELTLSAQDFSLENLVVLRRNTTLRGRGSLALQVGGTLSHPTLAAQFDLRGVGLGDKAVAGVQGGLEWHERHVLLKDVKLLQNEQGRGLTLSGEIELAPSASLPASFADLLRAEPGREPRVGLSLAFSDTDMAALAEMLDMGGSDGLRGYLDGTAEVRGSLAGPRVVADLRARALGVGSVEAGSGSLVFDWDGPAHQLAHLAASIEGKSGSLQLSHLHGPKADTVAFRARDFNLALVKPFLPWNFPVSGSLTGDAEMGGDLLNPEVSGRFSVRNGSVSALTFDTFTGAVRGKDGVYHLDNFVLAKGPHRAYLSGEIPVRRKPGGHLVFPAPLQLSGRVSESNLDILSLFIPSMLPSTGRLHGRFVASGVYPDLHYTADFAIHDGTFRHSRLQLPVENLQVAVRVLDRRLEVQTFTGTLGKGAFTLRGGADLQGVGVENMDFRLDGQALSVGVVPYLASTLDANLRLSGTLAAPRLTGNIATRSARFRLPLGELASASPSQEKSAAPASGQGSVAALSVPASHGMPPVDVEVRVDLGRSAWLTFLNSAVRAEGNLRFSGTWPHVAPVGYVALRAGQIQVPLLPVSFRVASGRAYFDKSTGWMPRLAATAVTQSAGYDVYLDVRGKASDPTVRLTSNPPLSPAAIQQLLMGGVPYNPITMAPQGSTGSLGTAALVGIAEATFLQPVTSALRGLFSLSEVTLEFVQTGGVQFRISKSLDALQRFFLTFSSLQGNNNQNLPRNVYGFEYRFSPYQLVRISSDDTGALNFFYQARMRF